VVGPELDDDLSFEAVGLGDPADLQEVRGLARALGVVSRQP
jgi:hypothetical protein